MSDITPFREGPRELVDKMNQIIKAVNAFNSLTGDGIIQTKQTARGTTIALSMDALRRRLVHGGTGRGGSSLRIAFVKTVPGPVSVVDCYLDEFGTGEEVEVQCSIAGGGPLDEAFPLLTVGITLFVTKVGDVWTCVGMPFQRWINKICT